MVSLSLSSYVKAGDEHNHVNIDQVSSSDNFNLSIEQVGNANLARFSFNHNSNTVNLLQFGSGNYFGYSDAWGSGYSWGGDLDGASNDIDVRQKCSAGANCNDNDFQFHVWGDNNIVKFGQGYSLNDTSNWSPTWSYDSNEPGGNFVLLDIHGDSNKFIGSQKMDTNTISHSMTVKIYSDSNDVFARQAQNGNKTLTLQINSGNDGNDVYINQRDNGAHTATITLSGTHPTDLDLLQRGNTNQSYTLTQNCLTTGGCSVSVTQGN